MPSITISDIRLEYCRIDGDERLAPLVFLHEGLGSIELWREFPARICAETGHPGFVYSRHGHGWSDPLTSARTPRFMHEEALATLPRLLDELQLHHPVLIGHSDGASIALIHAGAGRRSVSAVVGLAPHVFVEPESLAGTIDALRTFEDTDMREKMAKYHHDPAGTFYGWYGIWNSRGFRHWNIEDVLPTITCPMLVLQGADDQYGTVAQVQAIERHSKGPVERVWLPDCGHSPHLEKPDATAAAVVAFIESLG